MQAQNGLTRGTCLPAGNQGIFPDKVRGSFSLMICSIAYLSRKKEAGWKKGIALADM